MRVSQQAEICSRQFTTGTSFSRLHFLYLTYMDVGNAKVMLGSLFTLAGVWRANNHDFDRVVAQDSIGGYNLD